MSPVRMLLVSVLAATGLVAVGASTQSAVAASSKDLELEHPTVMKNEIVGIGGRVTTKDARPVKLQSRSKKSSGAWKTFDTTGSSSQGYIESSVQLQKSAYVRYYAPASAGRKAIAGNPLKVKVVGQTVTYFGVTPDFQCTNVDHGKVTMFAKFSPVRKGRTVTFLTNAGIGIDVTDGRGVASVTFDPGVQELEFGARAQALSYQDSAAKLSSTVSYEQRSCAG